MKLLTIFTPTYNRAHTLPRLYESLINQSCQNFEWLVIDDGSCDNTKELIDDWIREKRISLRYIYKENGGLYTGYNTAYANIDSELTVCIDSDDFMPKNAVELIVSVWEEKGGTKFAGITGLDFDLEGNPIGGFFPEWLKEGHFIDLTMKNIHSGDVKQVMRTDLMKRFIPMIGFENEKDFNPIYLLLQADDILPSIFINENLCFVEYQITDSMSAGIFYQYVRSPKSFAKMRLLLMSLKRATSWSIIKNNIHYNSSCILAHDKNWLKNSPKKSITLITRPLGWLLTLYIKLKVKN